MCVVILCLESERKHVYQQISSKQYHFHSIQDTNNNNTQDDYTSFSTSSRRIGVLFVSSHSSFSKLFLYYNHQFNSSSLATYATYTDNESIHIPPSILSKYQLEDINNISVSALKDMNLSTLLYQYVIFTDELCQSYVSNCEKKGVKVRNTT